SAARLKSRLRPRTGPGTCRTPGPSGCRSENEKRHFPRRESAFSVTVHGSRMTSVQMAEAMAGRATPDKYGSMEGSDWTARRQVAALTERKQETKRPNPPVWLFVPVSLFSHFFWPLPHSALAGFSRRGDQPNTNHSKGRLS